MYISAIHVGDDLSPLNVALFFLKIEAKSEWNFGHNLRGPQLLNRLARELLACGTLYQSCHSRPAVVSSLHVVAGLQRLLSFPANSKLVY